MIAVISQGSFQNGVKDPKIDGLNNYTHTNKLVKCHLIKQGSKKYD
jgi:hypothetical protein